MLNPICITTNQLEHIQTNLCIHLSYLEDQRNLKIYNKNIKKKKKKTATSTIGRKGSQELLCNKIQSGKFAQYTHVFCVLMNERGDKGYIDISRNTVFVNFKHVD